jgi:hypothetical protein
MREKIKFFGVIVLAVIIGFSIIACGNGTGNSNGGVENPTPDGGTVPNGGDGEDNNSWTVTNTTEWENAFRKIWLGGNNKSYTITVEGDVATNLNFPENTGISLTLQGTGRLYRIDYSSIILHMRTEQTLVIDSENLIIDGVISGNGGTLELKNGTIKNGGVSISDGGTFTMTGGTISENSSGGVSISGGGTFTMTGGTISGNTRRYGGGVYNGGGVYIEDGTFTMTGGTISGNTGSSGGGVCTYGGTFSMIGGTISSNTLPDNGGGGGVYIYQYCTFNMSGGTISNHTAYVGGGVYLYASGDPALFIKTGGIIYGNNEGINSNIATATYPNFVNSGNAVYVDIHKLKNSTLGENDNISSENTVGWNSAY